MKCRGRRFWPERKELLCIEIGKPRLCCRWLMIISVEGRGRPALWTTEVEVIPMMLLASILRGVGEASASNTCHQAFLREGKLNTVKIGKNRRLITWSLWWTEIILTKSLPQAMGGSLLQPSSKTTTALNSNLEAVCTQLADLKGPRDRKIG